ncbi:MAG: hypothetical protein ABSE06_12280 [Anaerolineaceae bacterium]|jgi:hypothetical protein
MKINFPTLSTYIESIHGISIGTVLHIVQRQWCGPMGVKGLCTEDCSKCSAHLQKAFQLDEARNPAALLTWSLKNELAAVQEETHVHEFVPPKDAFGHLVPMSEDVFGDLSKRYK